jgi:hypothetical protein
MATFWVGLYRRKYTRPLLSLFVQTYSYICSLHEEVRSIRMFSVLNIDSNMLFKVDVLTSIALDQGKMPLYYCTICAVFSLHQPSLQCVYLQHPSLRYELTYCILVNFTPDEDPNVSKCW